MSVQADQDGVVSRRQLIESGVLPHDIRRRLRRREWATVHPGVYVDHTGPPTWPQLAWAAVLFCWPAALAGSSALHAHGLRGYEPAPGSPIYVSVDRTRTVTRRIGIVVHQAARAESLWSPNLSPPRQSVEHALLEVASRSPRLDTSVAVLADGVQCGRTTADRLRLALNQRPKLRHRALLRDSLTDLDDGVRSVLERRYLNRVERAHGLPRAIRQRRVVLAGRPAYRDVEYVPFGVIIELDGDAGHSAARDRWQDLFRDLASAACGSITVRLGFAQVLDECRTAASVARLLHVRGWTELPRMCGPDCTVLESLGSSDAALNG